MTRRIAVLTAGSCSWCSSGVLGTLLPVPYVAQVPGPTYNTLGDIDGTPIISVEGREPERGQRQPQPDHGRASAAAGSAWSRRCAAGSTTRSPSSREESVYPPDQLGGGDPGRPTGEAFLTSEQAAESAALGHLGYPEKVVVQDVAEGLAVGGRARRRATPSTRSTGGRRPTPTTLDRRAHRRSPAARRSPSPTPGSATPGTAHDHHQGRPTDRKGSLLGVSVLEQPSAPVRRRHPGRGRRRPVGRA